MAPPPLAAKVRSPYTLRTETKAVNSSVDVHAHPSRTQNELHPTWVLAAKSEATNNRTHAVTGVQPGVRERRLRRREDRGAYIAQTLMSLLFFFFYRPESEAHRGRRLGLVGQSGIVQLELPQRVSQDLHPKQWQQFVAWIGQEASERGEWPESERYGRTRRREEKEGKKHMIFANYTIRSQFRSAVEL